MKNMFPVSEETARDMAIGFFERDCFFCAPHTYRGKRGYLCFMGAISLFVPKTYNKQKDKYPYGYILINDETFDPGTVIDAYSGKVYYIDGVTRIASSSVRYNDTGHTLAMSIESMLAAQNEDIEDPEYHLTDGVRKYLAKLVAQYEKEVKKIYEL